MSIVGRVASRFLLGRRATGENTSQGFVSFIASVSIAGLALGVTALLVVTSVMNGFERELKRSLTAFHGHILLFSKGEPVSDPERILKELPANFPEITAVSPYVFAEVMLSSAKGVAGAVIEGIDLETVGRVSRVGEKVIAGALPKSLSEVVTDPNSPASDPTLEIALGAEVARKLRVSTGDTVMLTIPFAQKGDLPLVRKLVVSGVIKIGMYDYDNKYALMEISDFQKLLGLGNRVNAFKILTRDPETSLTTTAAMNSRYTYPLRARDWSSLNRNLFFAIRLEKVVIAIILMAIVLVASFNIISTILMMVHDKKPQISMLKALGFSPRQNLAVFLLIGGLMSVLGTMLGLGLGRALCALVAWKSLIDLPADIYYFSRLPIEIRPWEWASICIAAIALAIGSTFLPSYRVSKQSPVEGLRYE